MDFCNAVYRRRAVEGPLTTGFGDVVQFTDQLLDKKCVADGNS
jgi:hypothetical protein